jgi:hypothetical protein
MAFASVFNATHQKRTLADIILELSMSVEHRAFHVLCTLQPSDPSCGSTASSEQQERNRYRQHSHFFRPTTHSRSPISIAPN